MTNAVEAAYRVFARYRIGQRLHVCNCPVCMTVETESRLAATPVREIPSDLLAELTNSAHETGPEGPAADELRYFLPRYFELIAAGDPPDTMGLDTCLRRLGRSGFRAVWPRDEIDAIDAFFEAFMAARVANLDLVAWGRDGGPRHYDLPDRIDETLTCLVTGGCDLPRVLTIWDEATDPGAATHMAEARLHVSYKGGRSYFRDAPLERDYREAAEAIAAFLLRPEVTRRIEEVFLAANDDGLEHILEKGLIYG